MQSTPPSDEAPKGDPSLSFRIPLELAADIDALGLKMSTDKGKVIKPSDLYRSLLTLGVRAQQHGWEPPEKGGRVDTKRLAKKRGRR